MRAWNDWDDDEDEAQEPDTPERAALREEALARATRDVRIVKTVHLTLVALSMIALGITDSLPRVPVVHEPFA